MQQQRRAYLIVGWLWYLGTLVPVIGLVQLYSQSIADRYTYVPLIGVYFLLVWGLCELAEWRQRKVVLPIITTIAVIACVMLTRHEISFWKDDTTVWRRAIAVTKNNYIAHNALGIVFRPTQVDAAFNEFREAVRINPNFADAQRYLADEFQRRGLLDDAIIHYQKSLETDPSSGWAEYGLGSALSKKGQTDKAVKCFQQAVKVEPGYARAHNSLGFIYYQEGKLDEAIIELQAVVKYDPTAPDAQNNLGFVLLEKGRIDDAVGRFQESLKLNPDYAEARTNLDLALKLKAQATTQTNQLMK
jgi:tetratricopeptide (TPR) repeat protein